MQILDGDNFPSRAKPEQDEQILGKNISLEDKTIQAYVLKEKHALTACRSITCLCLGDYDQESLFNSTSFVWRKVTVDN